MQFSIIPRTPIFYSRNTISILGSADWTDYQFDNIATFFLFGLSPRHISKIPGFYHLLWNIILSKLLLFGIIYGLTLPCCNGRVFANGPGDRGSISGQFQVESFQKLKKWYLTSPCLTFSIIRYISRVKWSNPGKGIAPSPTPRCTSYWKGSSGSPRLQSPTLLIFFTTYFYFSNRVILYSLIINNTE